jgi:glycosyltransferase involved in cell wall biosynthesis
MTRVLFVINTLQTGGAERQLAELVTRMDAGRFAVTVATFYRGGAFWDYIERHSTVALCCLEKRGRWDLIGFTARLLQLARTFRPHAIVGLVGGQLFVLPVGRLVGASVVWSIRHANMEIRQDPPISRLYTRLCALLSPIVDVILYNSHAGQTTHRQIGFRPPRQELIFNGIDTDTFRPDPLARATTRAEWRVSAHHVLVGVVGRAHPVKDLQLFFRAFAQVAERHPRTIAIHVGKADGYEGQALRNLVADLGIAERVTWAGPRADMPNVYNAFDVLASSSRDEAFPNAIAEAMSCGVPVVATDAGDSAALLGSHGSLVPRHDVNCFADGLNELVALWPRERRQLGAAARRHVVDNFAVDLMVSRMQSLLEAVGGRGTTPVPYYSATGDKSLGSGTCPP